MRILLTCGIGDFIAMESYMTDLERNAITAIHWATRAREGLMEIVPHIFPNLVDHVVERDTWGAPFTDQFCISSRDELPDLDPAVVDWNVRQFADEIRAGHRSYTRSTLVEKELGPRPDPEHKFPHYIAVHPYSDNARTWARDLTGEEWYAVQEYARRMRQLIVIINKGPQRMPVQLNVEVIDLTNELSVLDTIEVTKRAAAFIGCSSFPACIAAKVLPASKLFIKANASVKTFFYWLYYAPQESNAFLTHDVAGALRA